MRSSNDIIDDIKRMLDELSSASYENGYSDGWDAGYEEGYLEYLNAKEAGEAESKEAE